MPTGRAVASGVKSGDDYRGPRLRGGGLRSQPTGRGQPKKTFRTVDGPLLHVVTKDYHLHVFLSLSNLNIKKSLKHSNTSRGKAELSTGAQRAVSHRQQDQTELSFASSCTWTNKYPIQSPIQHLHAVFCDDRETSQIAWTLNLPLLALVQTYTRLCQNTRFGDYPRKNCQLCLKSK